MLRGEEIRLGTKSTMYQECLFKTHRPAGHTGWALLIALLVSMLLVMLYLGWRHRSIARYHDRVFGPAMGLRASILHADRDITYARLAKRVESQLASIAHEVSEAYFSIPCVSSRAEVLCDSLIQTELGRSIRATQDSLYNWALVARVGQYKLASAVDTLVLGTRQQREANTNLLCRFSRVVAELDSSSRRFPFDQQPTTWRMGTSSWNYQCFDSTRVLPAFLYAGLPVDNPAYAHQPLLSHIRRGHERAFAEMVEGDRKGKILTASYCRIDYPDSLWYRRLYAYVGFPATRLPRDYYPGARKWFQDTIRSGAVTWSPQYGDIGTGMPIVTCATPIYSPQEKAVGVLAVDLRAMSLAQWKQDGRPYLANLWLLFVVAVVLWGVLYVSGTWQYFAYILYAVVSLFAFYLIMSFIWIWNPEGGVLRWVLNRLETVASVINSFFFLLAAAHLRSRSRQGVSERLLRLFQTLASQYSRTTQFMLAAISSIALALMSWVATALVTGHGGWGGIYPHEIVEAGISMLALIFFGQRFAVWVSQDLRNGSPAWYLVMVLLFLGYGILQLAFPILDNWPEYYWALFIGKAVLLLLMLWWIFYYTQFYNGLKRQLGKITGKLFTRSIDEAFLLLIGKRVGTSTVLLACNGSLASLLRLDSDAAGRPVVPSILGDTCLMEPRGYSLDEVLAPGEVTRVGRLLLGEQARSGVRSLSNTQVQMRALDGRLVPVLFHRIAAWDDQHAGHGIDPQQMFVVALGSAPTGGVA